MNDQDVNIRPLELSDKMALAALANNKKVWDNLRDSIPHPYHEEDAAFFINLTKKQNPQQSFGITYQGELCGVISLIIKKDVYKKSAEIGYWIGEPYWKKGIAIKAVAQITKYGFKKLNLVRIYAGVYEYNIASMKVLESNGYLKEGIFKKAVIKNDKIWDEHRYYKLNKS